MTQQLWNTTIILLYMNEHSLDIFFLVFLCDVDVPSIRLQVLFNHLIVMWQSLAKTTLYLGGTVIAYMYLSKESFVDAKVETERFRIILKDVSETVP